MRVLIVDNSVQVIQRLEEIISEAKHISAIYKAVSYIEASDLIKKSNPDIVLLDIGLPGNRSADLITEIKRSNDTTTVIALSIHNDARTQQQFISLGADFFLDKYYDFEKLPGVIDAIAADKKKWLNRKLK